MRLLSELIGEWLKRSEYPRTNLHARRALEVNRKIRRLLDTIARSQLTVAGKHDRAVIAQCLGDDHPLLIGNRHARPVLQKCTVVVKRRHIHLRDHERLTRGSK